MIGTALLTILFFFLNAVISILPASEGLPDEIGTAFETIIGLAYDFNSVFPVDTFLTVLGLAVTFHAGIFLFNGLNWVIKKIPGVN